MTLKQKFRPLVWFNSGSFNVSQEREKDENSIKCEQIADNYAIEFAEWAIDYSFNGMYSNDVKELLEEFKKEKGV
jgi:hypothetical protein